MIIDHTIDNKPKVMVMVSAYNQENYIGEALESIIRQDVNFSIKILVQDDASSDRTADIIKDYASRYPDKIKAVLYEENQYRQGRGGFFRIWPMLEGEYIAFLDGDDYWTDANKLRSQVEFMDKNKRCAVCQTLSQYYNENNKSIIRNFPHPIRRRTHMFLEDLAHGNFLQTSAVMFRHSALPGLPDDFASLSFGDYAAFSLIACEGWIGTIRKVMVLYRVHSHNFWANQDFEDRQRKTAAVRNYIVRHIPADERPAWLYNRDGLRKPVSYRLGWAFRTFKRTLSAIAKP